MLSVSLIYKRLRVLMFHVGGSGFQIQRIAATKLNKHSRSTDNRWYSRLGG
jgi:hypothetical protein